MAENNYSELIKKASTINGAYIGCMWLASFICMANAVTSPLLSLLGLGIGIGSLFAIIIMAYQFYWKTCHGGASIPQFMVLGTTDYSICQYNDGIWGVHLYAVL